MKRWDFKQMLEIGCKLFAKINKKKRLAQHNHEIHFLAREIDSWMPEGIASIIEGTYTLKVDTFYIDKLISNHIMRHF